MKSLGDRDKAVNFSTYEIACLNAITMTESDFLITDNQTQLSRVRPVIVDEKSQVARDMTLIRTRAETPMGIIDSEMGFIS